MIFLTEMLSHFSLSLGLFFRGHYKNALELRRLTDECDELRAQIGALRKLSREGALGDADKAGGGMSLADELVGIANAPSPTSVLEERLRTLEAKVRELKVNNDLLEQTSRQAVERARKVEKENEGLRSELSAKQLAEVEFDQRLSTQRAAYDAELQRQAEQLSAKEREFAEIQSRLEHVSGELTAARKELSQQGALLSTLQTRFRELGEKNDTQSNNEATITALSSEIALLKDSLRTKETEERRLNEQRQQLEGRVKVLESHAAKLEGQISTLQRTARQLTEENHRLAERDIRIKALLDNANRDARRAQDFSRTIQKEQEEYYFAAGLADEERVKGETAIQILRHHIEAQDAELANLRRQQGSAAAPADDRVQYYESTIRELEAHLRRSADPRELEEARRHIDHLGRENQGLRSHLENMEKAIPRLEEQARQRQGTEQQASLRATSGTPDRSAEEWQRLREENDRLRGEIASLNTVQRELYAQQAQLEEQAHRRQSAHLSPTATMGAGFSREAESRDPFVHLISPANVRPFVVHIEGVIEKLNGIATYLSENLSGTKEKQRKRTTFANECISHAAGLHALIHQDPFVQLTSQNNLSGAGFESTASNVKRLKDIMQRYDQAVGHVQNAGSIEFKSQANKSEFMDQCALPELGALSEWKKSVSRPRT